MENNIFNSFFTEIFVRHFLKQKQKKFRQILKTKISVKND